MNRRLCHALAFVIVACMCACGPPPIVGSADVQGSTSNIQFNSSKAQSIVRTLPASGDPKNGEIMIALQDLACGYVGRSNHLTIDLGGIGMGTYTIVHGYPFLQNLHIDEARVHACSGGSSPQCDQQVVGGQVVITHYDADASGGVVGTFDVKFVDGEVSGSFQAPRCD